MPSDPADPHVSGTTRWIGKAAWYLFTAGLTVLGGVFGAGVYFAELRADVRKYKDIVDQNVIGIDGLNRQALSLKADLNTQFVRLNSLPNGYAFRNASGPGGDGYSAGVTPGRCPANEVVVGIQPLAGGGGITLQCGRIPLLRVE